MAILDEDLPDGIPAIGSLRCVRRARMILQASPESLTVLCDAGHGAYFPPKVKGLTTRSYSFEDDNLQPINLKLYDKLAKSPNNWLSVGEYADRWTTAIRMKGRLHAHAEGFKLLAGSLMPCLDPAGYTPGGDDDTFDYYPSGLRFLREWAMDLDTHVKDLGTADYTMGGWHYRDPGFHWVYTRVLLDLFRRERDRFEPFPGCDTWDHDETVTDLIEELMRDLSITRKEVIALVPR
jgi:hypothetical protein